MECFTNHLRVWEHERNFKGRNARQQKARTISRRLITFCRINLLIWKESLIANRQFITQNIKRRGKWGFLTSFAAALAFCGEMRRSLRNNLDLMPSNRCFYIVESTTVMGFHVRKHETEKTMNFGSHLCRSRGATDKSFSPKTPQSHDASN